MSATGLLLLIAAAGLHAVANALIKQARDKLAFAWWMLGVSSVLGLPILLLIGDVEPVGWLLVVISGVLEAVYFIALTRAYTLGDLSQVYPIARGSAQPFTVLWGMLLLGERPSVIGLLGVAVIVIGLYLVNAPSVAEWMRPLLGLGSPAARWALLTGLLISAYSAVDKQGVRYFDPIPYIYLILTVGWVALSPQWLLASRRAALMREIQPLRVDARPSLVSRLALRRRPDGLAGVVAAALFGVAAYVLVLAALQLSPVSYVGPTREISVVIGAWVGVRVLGESGGALRVAASGLVVAGVLLIAIGG